MWDLHRYRVMQEHWRTVAPPAYITSAGAAGWRPQASGEDEGGEEFVSPDNLGHFLSSIPGGHVQ